MATPNSVHEYLTLVEKSDLLEKDRLAVFVKAQGELPFPPATPRECANAFVKEGLLTRFQAKLLLAGKWRNFYLGGKYKVLDHLGSGGMGMVFLCEHRHMRRRVAVKILPPEKNGNNDSVQRFVREAQAVARLDHPNLVHAHDIDCDAGVYFIVMEYIDGVSLQHLIESRGPISVPRAVSYACQSAAGLHHACEAHLVHRDIKPSNLLLDRGGIIKILDLGLARFSNVEDRLTQMIDSKTVLGTADYLAPEQARDSCVDIRADIYSLGALFYFLLVGKPPFEGGNVAQKLIAHQTKTPMLVSAVRADIPPGVANVIASMMSKNPANRPQTPLEVVSRLRPWFEEVPPPTPEELPESRYTPHRDIDTMSRLSTVATMSSAMRSKILQSAASVAANGQS